MQTLTDLKSAISLFALQEKSLEILESLSHFLAQFHEIGRYFQHYSIEQRFKIIQSFKLQPFISDETIFHKGDPSSHYYFILDGQIEAFNIERDGLLKLVGMISTGKTLGETGILRNQPRSLTCIGKTNGYLLSLTSDQFLSLLAPHMIHTQNLKIKFIESYFPNVKKLTSVQKQRIAYAMNSYNASRGQMISVVGETSQVLSFIGEGEMIVKLTSDGNKRGMMLKLANGNLIGEECVFFNSSMKYNISVSSEYCLIYTLQKQDIYFLLPPETIQVWRRNFRAKDASRKQLISGHLEVSGSDSRGSGSFMRFKQATPYANKRLDMIQKMNEKGGTVIDFERKNLLIGNKLKMYSPAAVLLKGKFSFGRPKTLAKLSRYVSKNDFRINDQGL